MADSASPSSSRSKNGSTARGKARAASSDDVRRPAQAPVEPEPQSPPAPESVRQPSDAAGAPQFDPRQGTLLGFELPAEALASMSEPVVTAEPEPEPAASGGSGDDASPAPRETLLSPGAALASVREQAARRPLTARASGFPARESAARPAQHGNAFAVPAAAQAASAVSMADDTPRAFDTAPPDELARTVASLQEALMQERRAADDRWRRARRWLALGSAGLVVLFAVSVGQTVALVSFSHRAQAAQQQTQSALNEQQAALAGLASSASALAARIEPSARADAASDAASAANAAQRPAKHARRVIVSPHPSTVSAATRSSRR